MAFGFERTMVITDSDGNLQHSEMSFDGGQIMIGVEWEADRRSPASLGGKTTQSVHVHLQSGLDAHCERARAAGAKSTREPADEFYGDRVYGCRDPEGDFWTFAQTVRPVTREEAERASGLKIEGWVDS